MKRLQTVIPAGAGADGLLRGVPALSARLPAAVARRHGQPRPSRLALLLRHLARPHCGTAGRPAGRDGQLRSGPGQSNGYSLPCQLLIDKTRSIVEAALKARIAIN